MSLSKKFNALTPPFDLKGAESGDITASEITNVPSGSIVATNVQEAIDEIDTSKASLVAGKVPTSELGGAGADATKFLRGDQSWQVGTVAAPSGTGFRHVTAGVEDAASKLVVNADVDAAAAILATKIANTPAGDISSVTVQAALNELDTEKLKSSSGSFVTNGTDNRAIPHSLGKNPKCVWAILIGGPGSGRFGFLTPGGVWKYTGDTQAWVSSAGTAEDATNFYASVADFNVNGFTIFWIAIA